MFLRYTTWQENCSLMKCNTFALRAGVNHFNFFRTVAHGGLRFPIGPVDRTAHELSLRSFCCKAIRAGSGGTTTQGVVKNEQDARWMVRLSSLRKTGAAEGDTLLQHRLLWQSGSR